MFVVAVHFFTPCGYFLFDVSHTIVYTARYKLHTKGKNMHKHPTPVSIKTHVLMAMAEKFSSMTSQQVSDMIDALDDGVKAACIEHDKIWGEYNDQ